MSESPRADNSHNTRRQHPKIHVVGERVGDRLQVAIHSSGGIDYACCLAHDRIVAYSSSDLTGCWYPCSDVFATVGFVLKLGEVAGEELVTLL